MYSEPYFYYVMVQNHIQTETVNVVYNGVYMKLH